MGLVRVKLENGMEASLPEDHAIASGYKPLDKPATNSAGIALGATGPEKATPTAKKTAAKKSASTAKKAAAKKTTAPSGDAGKNA